MGWRNFHKAAIYVMVLSAHCVLTLHGQTPKLQNPLGNGPEVVAAGRDVYNNNCTDCHGRDGTQGGRAPALAGDRRYFRLSEAAIFDTIKNGIPGTSMQSLDLEDNDIWRIVAYIRNLRGTASDNIVPGNAEHGARVYANSGCQKCHMILGQGGTIGPDLSSIGGQVTLKHLREALTQETLIPRGYRPVKVTAQNGEVVEGVARNEDGFSIQILDQHNQLHLYDKGELREIIYGKKSLMPRNYDQILSANEFQDLLAMLSRQARTKVNLEQQGAGEIGR